MEKAYKLKEVMSRPERLAPGHRMCAGCGGTVTVRAVLRALHPEDKAVIGNATGCLEVSTFMYPYTAYEDSYIHNAFENAGATLSGVETTVPLRALMTKGLHLVGSTLRSRAPEYKAMILAELVEKLWPKIENGEMKPVIYRVLPMAEAETAHQILTRNENTGKVVLTLPQ